MYIILRNNILTIDMIQNLIEHICQNQKVRIVSFEKVKLFMFANFEILRLYIS